MVKIMQKLLIIMEVFKNIFCLSKFAWAQGMVFFDICGKFCHASSKRFVIPVIKRSQYGKIFCLNFYQDITLCLTCARVSFYFVCVVICAHDLMNA